MCRNFLPRLVLTFELNGGLYHVTFLLRFVLFFGAHSCEGLYVSLWSYPLSLRAFWYEAMDSSKVALLDEMVVNRLLMLSGMFLLMLVGGCFVGGQTTACHWALYMACSCRL